MRAIEFSLARRRAAFDNLSHQVESKQRLLLRSSIMALSVGLASIPISCKTLVSLLVRPANNRHKEETNHQQRARDRYEY